MVRYVTLKNPNLTHISLSQRLTHESCASAGSENSTNMLISIFRHGCGR